jgi:hypothetical protein
LFGAVIPPHQFLAGGAIMIGKWKNQVPMVVGTILMVAALVILVRSQPANAQRADATSTPQRYTVIETQGFNLLVTDNMANKLYYYATDKDVPVGSPMKLRASLDLAQVGREEIKITPHNLENIRKKDDK